MLDQAQVLYHLGVQQADRVARGRVAKARVEFLGDCGSAKYGSALEDAYRKPGPGEVTGAGEAVMAPAYNHHIEARGGA
jgi:hypothetical protein